MFSRVKEYFIGAKQEFKSIQWPTFAQTRGLTITVIAIALIVAIYLGVFDYAFSYLLGKILVV